MVVLNKDKIDKLCKKHNLPVTDIDKEILELVILFNEIGLKTEFCCIGHSRVEPISIIFHKCVSDEMLYTNLTNIFGDEKTRRETHSDLGVFQKWVRLHNSKGKDLVFENWCFTGEACMFSFYRTNMKKRIKYVNSISKRIYENFVNVEGKIIGAD